jgi:hypothetical protein
MDRKTRRMHPTRLRSRRTKLVAGISIAAASVVVLAAAAFGQQESGTPQLPKPQVNKVDLTPAPVPVDAGWEGQVGTHANLAAVQWNGDSSARFTFEVRNKGGQWHKAADTGVFDNGPDPGTVDARHGGATPQTKNVTDPVWIGRDVTGVRLRLDDASAQDVTLHVIDSTTGQKPETAVESTVDNSPPSTAPPPPSVPPQTSGGSPSTSTSTTTTTTTPLQSGIGQGLAAAALATLAVAFIIRRRRTLAVVVAGAILVFTACTPVKGGPPGGSMPGSIVTRSAWGGDLPWACQEGQEFAPYLSYAIVHHTVNSNNYGPGDSVGMIRGIWAYHVYSLGYCDIAYNFIIDNYGVPFEGRWNSIYNVVTGAHALGWNYSTTGIAMLGTFSSVLPSDGAMGTLINLIRWKFQLHGLNPFDRADAHILGHRDTYATECPGQALYDQLPSVRFWMEAGW